MRIIKRTLIVLGTTSILAFAGSASADGFFLNFGYSEGFSSHGYYPGQFYGGHRHGYGYKHYGYRQRYYKPRYWGGGHHVHRHDYWGGPWKKHWRKHHRYDRHGYRGHYGDKRH